MKAKPYKLYVDGANRLVKLESTDGSTMFRGSTGLLYDEDGTANDGVEVHNLKREFRGLSQHGAANLMLTVALNAANPRLNDEEFRDFVVTSYTVHENLD
jgi:hypothetical protein